MKSFMEHPWSLWSVVLGLFVLWTYALKRFNEPTFQEKKALPNTVYPVQYLFLPPDYARARSAYLIILTSVYLVFVLAGPDVIPPDWAKVFPPESFALGLAAVFAGLLPNSDSQFLKMISSLEVELRRRVHAAFFVPSRIEETIVVLDTAPYDPPPGLLEFIAQPLRDELKRDLRNRKLRSTSLEYRWARARMLMEALAQIGRNREVLPLEVKDFAPFAKDLETLREKYKKLERDMATIDRRPSADSDELANAVDDLLYGIYAYIAWGVRRQAKKKRGFTSCWRRWAFGSPTSKGAASSISSFHRCSWFRSSWRCTGSPSIGREGTCPISRPCRTVLLGRFSVESRLV
jgi:hypothetical protein